MAITLPGCEEGFGLGLPALRSLCLIISHFGIANDGLARRRHGTGFLFHSSANFSYVLTAGHNIYNHDLRRFARSADLWFGRYGESWHDFREMAQARVPETFRASYFPDPRSDYGVMQVARLDPARFIPFGLMLSPPSQGADARMPGYPNEGAAKNSHRPFYFDPLLAPAGPTNFDYSGDPITYVGQSGAPLLVPNPQDGPSACGIHIRGQGVPERALRFSSDFLRQLDEWL